MNQEQIDHHATEIIKCLNAFMACENDDTQALRKAMQGVSKHRDALIEGGMSKTEFEAYIGDLWRKDRGLDNG